MLYYLCLLVPLEHIFLEIRRYNFSTFIYTNHEWIIFKPTKIAGFKPTKVGLIIHGSSLNDTNLVAKELIKLNNTINTYLIRPNSILCYYLPLNACGCLICEIYQ